MKRAIFLVIVLAAVVSASAQTKRQNEPTPEQIEQLKTASSSSLQLDINTLSLEETDVINTFIERQRLNRSFFGTIGLAVLGTIITQSAGFAVDGIMQATQINARHKAEWEQFIKNECVYVDSLSYIDNLTDFYSKGSEYGALDPSDFQFNGFTVNAQKEGKDVLRFYCHVDTSKEGLDEIINHSKFHLLLDSMYFYPYRCHLPNLTANQINPEDSKDYSRHTNFSFKDRNNLSVRLNFTITSSWYNQAIMLAKDVELGQFSIEIPIHEDYMTDDVFVYKSGMEGLPPLTITGDCFIVPRSYMPLTNGIPHWGTGEYNVKVTLSEQCDINKDIRKDWKKDYRSIKKMKKNKDFWPQVESYCIQNGRNLLRCTLNAASSSALGQWGWLKVRKEND